MSQNRRRAAHYRSHRTENHSDNIEACVWRLRINATRRFSLLLLLLAVSMDNLCEKRSFSLLRLAKV